MNGKSYSVPAGMVFSKYYCAKCGTKLKKEKTHRIVTQFDQDYYQYHDLGTFPLRDYDVYSYRFQCPSCHARISYDEQCIIKRIQKKQGHFVLSSSEIKRHYRDCKKSSNSGVLISNILISVLFILIGFAIFYLVGPNRTTKDFIGISILFLIFGAYALVSTIRKYKGNYKSKFKRTYSYEKETQMERLQAYSSHNRNSVAVSNVCHCFRCMKSMKPMEITLYQDDGQTALCPNCGFDTVLPDGIDEVVDEEIIAEMHEYWF